MSYKHVVLRDRPTSFYLLDEVRSSEFGNYNTIMSQFATYQDVVNNFTSYSQLNGLPVYDYSGNNNDGVAMFASKAELMPIISGGVRGTQVLDNTSIILQFPYTANKYYSDVAFSIEAWARPCDSNNGYLPIVADITNSIGIFYNNGDYVFSVNGIESRFKYSNSKASHIVGVYDKTSISLYIDGMLVNTTQLNKFRFSNTTTQIEIGPATSSNSFIVDGVAFYRFAITENQIKTHYNSGIEEIDYSQIVYPDNGSLFSINHSKIKSSMRYGYPYNKKWSTVANGSAVLSSDQSYLTFAKTNTQSSATFSFTDIIAVPNSLGITTSQISYDDIDNILVEASIDEVTWVACQNNSPIPFFNKKDGVLNDVLFLRVTMSSSDTSVDLPRLKEITLDFFSNKDFYSDNSGDRIYSNSDYGIMRYNYPVLSHNKYNGLTMCYGGQLHIDTQNSVKSIEMIYTPVSGQGVLVSSNSKIFEWSSSGVINKSGISAIYVNGIDHTSSTNISDFLYPGYPVYIVIVFSTAATSNIILNSNQDGSKSVIGSAFSNVAIYPDQLSLATSQSHYDLYRDRPFISVSDNTVVLSESVTGHDNTAYFVNEIGWTTASI